MHTPVARILQFALAAFGVTILAWGIIGLISIARTYNGVHDVLLRLYPPLVAFGALALCAALAIWLLSKRHNPRVH